ncbi:MAG: hypothetical protein IPO36_22595 [Anaerolineales bacterium]|nr:hypothetical protein [Anaerolineales bacterium]
MSIIQRTNDFPVIARGRVGIHHDGEGLTRRCTNWLGWIVHGRQICV